jgi:hypothetical protein
MVIINFGEPALNLEGEFNTFRVGKIWSSRVKDGDIVGLMTTRNMRLIGKARVLGVFVGPLRDMAESHAKNNHNQKHLDPQGAWSRLIAAMRKRYRPRVIEDHSVVTVIYLKRLE